MSLLGHSGVLAAFPLGLMAVQRVLITHHRPAHISLIDWSYAVCNGVKALILAAVVMNPMTFDIMTAVLADTPLHPISVRAFAVFYASTDLAALFQNRKMDPSTTRHHVLSSLLGLAFYVGVGTSVPRWMNVVVWYCVCSAAAYGVNLMLALRVAKAGTPKLYRLFACVYALSLLVNWGYLPTLIGGCIDDMAVRLAVLITTAGVFLLDDLKLLKYMAFKGELLTWEMK